MLDGALFFPVTPFAQHGSVDGVVPAEASVPAYRGIAAGLAAVAA